MGGTLGTQGRRMVRPAVSLALVVLATLLLVPAVILTWAQREVYDSDRFVDHAVTALEDEEVRAALVQAIVNEIVSSGPPEALSARPLVELVVATVVETQLFLGIYQDAVADVHTQLFEPGAPTRNIPLILRDAIAVVNALMQDAYPDVAGDLPTARTTPFIQIRPDSASMRVARAGNDSTFVLVGLPTTLVALYLGALATATDRRRTLGHIGLGSIAVGVMLIVGRDYMREIVLSRIALANPGVAEPFWNAYTSSLTGWALIVGGAGVALALAATGRHHISVQQHLDFARRAVEYTPAAMWGRVLRAASFVVLGLVAITQRDSVLELVLVAGGAYLFYYGINELIWLAGPAADEVERKRSTELQRGELGRLALRGGAVAMLAGAVVATTAITYRALETPTPRAMAEVLASKCNGHEELCDRRLDEVTLLGTHNSMSNLSKSDWFFAEHLGSIRSQLDSGVRVLMIDTWYGYDTGRGVRTAEGDFVGTVLPEEEYGPEVAAAAQRIAAVAGLTLGPKLGLPEAFVCHTWCELGATSLREVLGTVNGFVEANPGEIVVLLIQDQISPEDTARAFIASGLVKHVYHHVEGQPFLTLREMVERDQRVVVFAERDASGVSWYLPAYEYIQETPFVVRSAADLTCDPGRGDPRNPLFQLNNWISGSIPSIQQARTINDFDFLYGRALNCEAERGRRVNMIHVNFSEVGDAKLVVDVLNGVAEPPAEED